MLPSCPIHTLASAYLVTESQHMHFLLIVLSTYCIKSTHAYTSQTYITRYIIILRYISVCVLTFFFPIIFDRFTFMVFFGEKICGRMACSSNLMATRLSLRRSFTNLCQVWDFLRVIRLETIVTGHPLRGQCCHQTIPTF